MRTVTTTVLVALCIGVGAVAQRSDDESTCRMTLPGSLPQTASGFYGTNDLAFSGPWHDGIVVFKPGGPGFVLPDGSLSMKFGWQRGVSGPLMIDGRRLDATAPPLRAHIPAGYGDIGFQATALIFPTPGCWEVTGRVGNASLTFITKVIRIGGGPSR